MKTRHLELRVDEHLIDRIDAWRNLQPFPPSRVAAISYMLEGWLDNQGTQAVEPRPLAPPGGPR